MVQIVVGSQGQIARPTAAVQHTQRSAQVHEVGGGQSVRQMLEELIDLCELAPHGRFHPTGCVGHAHDFKQTVRPAFGQW